MSKKVCSLELVAKERGLSFSQLSRKADVCVTSIYRIRRGIEPAFPKRGEKLAKALEWDGELDKLFEFVEIEEQ